MICDAEKHGITYRRLFLCLFLCFFLCLECVDSFLKLFNFSFVFYLNLLLKTQVINTNNNNLPSFSPQLPFSIECEDHECTTSVRRLGQDLHHYLITVNNRYRNCCMHNTSFNLFQLNSIHSTPTSVAFGDSSS